MNYSDSTPVLVLIDDYLERAKIAAALADEADLYGIEVFQSSTPEDAQQRWPTGAGNRGRAALALIDAGSRNGTLRRFPADVSADIYRGEPGG